MPTVSVIIPVHNANTTIQEALNSLFSQNYKFDELVIVNDSSNDDSDLTIYNFLKEAISKFEQKPKVVIINHKKTQGLASSYNDGIRNSSKDLVVTMRADIVIKDDGLKNLISPFIAPEETMIVASTHYVDHPLEIWKQYNFWQKCFFARLAGEKYSGIDGKFDCFRKSTLEQIGMFGSANFRVAGEDGDLVAKIFKIGRIVQTEAEIVHLHKIDDKFGWKDIIAKQKQYSEAQGALLRRGRITELSLFIKSFFREILLVAFLIPYIWIISAIGILVYSFWYTGKVYRIEWRNWRILVLPFFNMILLPISFWYSLRGIIYGKQRI